MWHCLRSHAFIFNFWRYATFIAEWGQKPFSYLFWTVNLIYHWVLSLPAGVNCQTGGIVGCIGCPLTLQIVKAHPSRYILILNIVLNFSFWENRHANSTSRVVWTALRFARSSADSQSSPIQVLIKFFTTLLLASVHVSLRNSASTRSSLSLASFKKNV